MKIIAISGVKNSGKTTLIEHLLPELNTLGIWTAVIKHDGHDFEPDVPGTDSYRIRKAGAYGTAVFSASKYLLVKEIPCADDTECPSDHSAEHSKEASREHSTETATARAIAMVEQLKTNFPEADLILLEGFKFSPYPKVEIVRKGNSGSCVCDPATLLAVVSDFEPQIPAGVPLYDLNDPAKLAEFLVTCL